MILRSMPHRYTNSRNRQAASDGIAWTCLTRAQSRSLYPLSDRLICFTSPGTRRLTITESLRKTLDGVRLAFTFSDNLRNTLASVRYSPEVASNTISATGSARKTLRHARRQHCTALAKVLCSRSSAAFPQERD